LFGDEGEEKRMEKAKINRAGREREWRDRRQLGVFILKSQGLPASCEKLSPRTKIVCDVLLGNCCKKPAAVLADLQLEPPFSDGGN